MLSARLGGLRRAFALSECGRDEQGRGDVRGVGRRGEQRDAREDEARVAHVAQEAHAACGLQRGEPHADHGAGADELDAGDEEGEPREAAREIGAEHGGDGGERLAHGKKLEVDGGTQQGLGVEEELRREVGVSGRERSMRRGDGRVGGEQ